MVSPTARRALPSVDRVLRCPAAGALIEEYGRTLVVDNIRAALDEQRSRLADAGSASPDDASLVAAVAARLRAATAASLKPVFNLTGTVLHTNLGRALLPKAAAEAALAAMTRPVNLEFALDSGERGERDAHVETWLKRFTGAQAAMVVNNNAAAVYLVLNTLALRKEVLVSRGELIEIGGAFRIPDIMARAGCRLREVGTTNRTHAGDFAAAIGNRCAAIMKVHASNYAIQGYTAAVAEAELAKLARDHALPFVVDLGSGTLVDLEDFGLPHEPTPRQALAAGADLVTFSGDKLLGGPQCGLIVGTAALIERLKNNPLKRALRVDKITLAALEAVLRLYADPKRLQRELPTLRMLTRSPTEIEAQAHRLLPALSQALAGRVEAQVVACASQIGSGALPVDALPSTAIALTPRARKRGAAAAALAAAFRALPVPVLGRVKQGSLILDLRCLSGGSREEDEFVAQLAQLRLPAA